MVAMDAGWFMMGSTASTELIQVAAFHIAACCVSNRRFAAFVGDTGYLTDAERVGWSSVSGRRVPGAYWRRPNGWHSTVEGCEQHPVVHVSRRDALAYCAWAARRLPTDTEWEYAARGGLDGRRYPWGDEPRPGGERRMNAGRRATVSVTEFPPNRYGLFGVTGNVWEWTADPAGVVRGGSYLNDERDCPVWARMANPLDRSAADIGFRCALDARTGQR
jgi:formylglycine-generating enzyme required for sulfatase activity